ncbi:MAG: hypothetical protein V9E87_11575 [Gemmatimonadales bacterium]
MDAIEEAVRPALGALEMLRSDEAFRRDRQAIAQVVHDFRADPQRLVVATLAAGLVRGVGLLRVGRELGRGERARNLVLIDRAER